MSEKVKKIKEIISNTYHGPILTKKDRDKGFWDHNRTKPLGGCIEVKLSHIVDGDTVHFEVGKEIEKVRLFVIDTKEIHPHPQPYAIEAEEFVKHTLENAKEILLQSDINDKLRDSTSSKRLLAWVWVDGKLLNYILVREGFASVRYIGSKKLKYLKALIRAEKYAKRVKLRIYKK